MSPSPPFIVVNFIFSYSHIFVLYISSSLRLHRPHRCRFHFSLFALIRPIHVLPPASSSWSSIWILYRLHLSAGFVNPAHDQVVIILTPFSWFPTFDPPPFVLIVFIVAFFYFSLFALIRPIHVILLPSSSSLPFFSTPLVLNRISRYHICHEIQTVDPDHALLPALSAGAAQ
jgi:hypothetical protein